MLIHKYTSDWVAQFELLKQALDQALNGLDYQIEHVGSTAVPGLAAKPIIDIDIIYNSADDFDKIKAGLINAGYYHNGNQGIEKREVFKRNSTAVTPPFDTIRHHLYACEAHCHALDQHIIFRDFLRKNKSARDTYEGMKYALAEKAGQDKKLYAHLKETALKAFVNSIVEKEKKDQT